MTTVTYHFNGYDNSVESWQTEPGYMVDNRETSKAHGWADRTQLCNSNTCSGTNLGIISKVEIRLKGYRHYTHITPIFADGDGDTYTSAADVGLVPTWSDWWDITTDTNAPTIWKWSHVKNLDCRATAQSGVAWFSGVYMIQIRVTYDERSSDCGSCDFFRIKGDTYTVDLKMPQHNGEDNSINKNINRFNFWSGNYDVNDDGINSQPLILTGIEFASCDDEYVGLQLGECARFNLYFNMKFTNKFRFLMEMADNNEEVVISGLGDCMDATYIIKHFSYNTDTPRSRSWTMTLEKVR